MISAIGLMVGGLGLAMMLIGLAHAMHEAATERAVSFKAIRLQLTGMGVCLVGGGTLMLAVPLDIARLGGLVLVGQGVALVLWGPKLLRRAGL